MTYAEHRAHLHRLTVEYLKELLARHSDVRIIAAREAGMDRSNFLRLLKSHGLQQNSRKRRKLK